MKTSKVDELYKWGREIMMAFSKAIHLRYEELNIIIFVILGPLVFLWMLWKIRKQQLIIKDLKNRYKSS